MLFRNHLFHAFAVAVVALCGFASFAPIASAQTKTKIDKAAPRADQTAFIAGRVFDARTKKGIAGAQISWEGVDDLFESTTDAQGNYRIPHVVPIEKSDSFYYAYAVTAPGYSTRSNYGSYEDVKIWVPKSGLQMDFAMLGQAKISGQVQDSAGRPVAGAHVHVYEEAGNNSETVATDKTGNWRVDSLDVPFAQGVLALKIEAFDPRFSQVESDANVRADGEAKITQKLPARAVIRGRLTRGGKPLANAYVQVDSEEGMGYFNNNPNYGLPHSNVFTDKNGRYRLLVSAPKTFKLSLSENDSVGQEITVVTRPGQTVVVNRELKPFRYGSIRGRVLDLNGKPLAGGDIELWDRDTSQATIAATTDKAGRFFIAKVAPRDDYQASVMLPGSQYSSNGRSETLRVRSHQTTNVTIRVDTEKPTLEVPNAPRVVSGTVKVNYQVSDNRGIWFVSLGLDGGDLNNGRENLSVHFDEGKYPRKTSGSIAWDTRRSPNGRHRLRVETADKAGNVTRREWFVWIQNNRAPIKADAATGIAKPK